MKVRTRLFAAIVTIAGFGIDNANSATILTSPAEFSTPNILIGFEAFPNGQQVPYGAAILSDQWQSNGFLISDSSPATGAAASSGTGNIPSHSGTRAISDSERNTPGGFIEFQFIHPVSGLPGTVTEAGLWVQNADFPSTVTFFDRNGGVLQTILTDSSDDFVGIHADEGIARLRVEDNDIYLVDDLQFAPVPEPLAGALALVLLGVPIFRRQSCTDVACRKTRIWRTAPSK
jgi:hypothetical protein